MDAGGATDIIATDETKAPTGVLFHRQDADAVTDAIEQFETIASRITSQACRTNALRFSQARFQSEVHSIRQPGTRPELAIRGAGGKSYRGRAATTLRIQA